MGLTNIIRYVFGYTIIEISADTEQFISYLIKNKIGFWNVSYDENRKATLCIYRRSVKYLAGVSERFSWRKVTDVGIVDYISKRVKRPGLVAGVFICLAASYISTMFVWDVTIIGNERLSVTQVTAMLRSEGFKTGCFMPSVDIRRLNNILVMKNSADLAWISINMHGTVANVEIRERQPPIEIFDDDQPTNIIASKGGHIIYSEVYQGQPLVKTGDTVMPGQLLVSSLIDSNTVGLRVRHASARIEAITHRQIIINVPWKNTKKVYTGKEDLRFSVKILENLINFNYNSSISVAKYDKIVESEMIVLFGGIRLPIYLIKDKYREYFLDEYTLSPEQARSQARSQLNNILSTELGRIQIASREVYYTTDETGLTLTCYLECIEDIAQEQAIVNDSKFLR